MWDYVEYPNKSNVWDSVVDSSLLWAAHFAGANHALRQLPFDFEQLLTPAQGIVQCRPQKIDRVWNFYFLLYYKESLELLRAWVYFFMCLNRHTILILILFA